MCVKFAGHVAVVTGAGSGIGRAIAQAFAQEQAKVVIVDWNREAGERAAREIQESGLNAAYRHVDVSKSREVESLMEGVAQEYGRLDVLVNNAAIQILAQLVETKEEDWDRLHGVNLKGVFLCCKYAIPRIIASGGGAIINIASVLGFVGDPDLAAYCAAKGGVIALTKAAALGYGPKGVRLNCICPGDVDTPLFREYIEKDSDPERLRSEIFSKYALRRVAKPEDIARAAVFLASGDSSFVTGSTMVVDGGLTIKCY
jgi:NAD(P)-dependent dehydrogenase (short-subunit alcohol dehydrogenase family)